MNDIVTTATTARIKSFNGFDRIQLARPTTHDYWLRSSTRPVDRP
jgi:hypothetical protein